MNKEPSTHVIPDGIPTLLAERLTKLEWASAKLNQLSRIPNGKLKDQCIQDIQEVLESTPMTRDEIQKRLQVSEATVLRLRKEIKELEDQLDRAQSFTSSDELLNGPKPRHNVWAYVVIGLVFFILGRIHL